VLSGTAVAQIGDQTHSAAQGALIVPAGVQFNLSNPSVLPFRAIAVLPVGGRAQIGQQASFTPPWIV